MATYSHRTVTTVREEFTIPAAPPFGATAAEIEKAWEAAQQAYWKALDIPFGGPLPDDAITFRPGDDEIVISFETDGLS